MKGKTTLYIGMAYDILHPLLLLPEVETIYAISLFDKCFSEDGTWLSQKVRILNILVSGKYQVYDKFDKAKVNKLFTARLKGPSTILEEYDDENNNRWYVKFFYQGKERELIYYHHRNALITWPKEIQKVESLMCIGSLSHDNLYFRENKVLRKMLMTRCVPNFPFIGEVFNLIECCELECNGRIDIWKGKWPYRDPIAFKFITRASIQKIIDFHASKK